MRGSGISGAKTRSLRDLSKKVLAGEVDLNKIYSLSDTDVILELTKTN